MITHIVRIEVLYPTQIDEPKTLTDVQTLLQGIPSISRYILQNLSKHGFKSSRRKYMGNGCQYYHIISGHGIDHKVWFNYDFRHSSHVSVPVAVSVNLGDDCCPFANCQRDWYHNVFIEFYKKLIAGSIETAA